ncbi:hypothetical protein M5E87_04845 [Flavonifractor plautii]|nr:hypothetical protein M5E87_04845 [Flavonifractor plautii]
MSEIVQFLRRLPSLADYELLPYHNWGRESTANWAGAIHWPDWSRRTGGGKAPQRRAAG